MYFDILIKLHSISTFTGTLNTCLLNILYIFQHIVIPLHTFNTSLATFPTSHKHLHKLVQFSHKESSLVSSTHIHWHPLNTHATLAQ